ncbi:MAG: hypothetical protein PGN13_05525 [Patulibacter minatonensis]
MTPLRGLAALGAAGLALGLTACGGDSAGSGRPAHRPISVVYVVGDPRGPWAGRTEGLADGVKIAIAERDGLVGERAASIVVVPVVQRDGPQVSAAVGAGRILRDSRALAAIGTWTSPQLTQVAAQLNGGEVTLLQYGSGTNGLLSTGLPGEPSVYQPSGKSLALRGVPGDAQVAAAIRGLPGLRGADVVVSESTFAARNRASREEAAKAAEAEIATLRGKKPPTPEDELPDPAGQTIRSLYNEQSSDGTRLAEQVRKAVGGAIRPVGVARRGTTVAVIDSEQPDAAAEARSLARRTTGTLVLVDAADRAIPAGAVAGHRGTVYRVRRTLDDPATAAARRIRAKERELFGRDRGESVVAGYRAARRILELAASQPAKTIERMPYASGLVADAPDDPDLPVKAGQVSSGRVVVERLSGGRWTSAR